MNKIKINTLEVGQICKYTSKSDSSHYSVYLGDFIFLVLSPITKCTKNMTSFHPQLLSEMRGNYVTKYEQLENVHALNYTLKTSKLLEEYKNSANKAYIKPSNNELVLIDNAIHKIQQL